MTSINKSRYLAIVPARAGSKRIRDKNIADLGGVPLLAWSVRAGLDCPGISEVFVSTDSEKYQQVAVASGGLCPILREARLSMDTTGSAEVVIDVLDWYSRERGQKFEYVVLLQPTSPLRTAEDIRGAMNLQQSRQAPAVVSVCEAECPPAWVGKIDQSLNMDDFIDPKYRGLRSQDLGTYYRINGAVYIIDAAILRSEKSFMPKGTLGYVMPRSRSIDIDTIFDLELARLMVGHGGDSATNS